MKSPLISIAIIAYNQSEKIEDTIQSVINQTYKNIELIVIDDCSTDNTFSVVESLLPKIKDRFVRVKLLRNKKNIGNIPYNINRCLEVIKGEFFKPFGGDDILLPDYIEKMIEVSFADPTAAAYVSDMYIVSEKYKLGDDYSSCYRFMKADVPDTPEEIFHSLMKGNFLPAPGELFRTQDLIEIGGFNEEIVFEDYDVWLRLSHYGKRIRYVDIPLVLYRRSDNSLTNFNGERILAKFINEVENTFYEMDKYIELVDDIGERAVIWDRQFEDLGFILATGNIPEGEELLEKEIEKRQLSYSVKHFVHSADWLSTSKVWSTEYGSDLLINILKEKNIKTFAVYGYGNRGKQFVNFLEAKKISFAYIIDRRGQSISEKFKVFTLEERMPQVDAVIVAMDNVKMQLKKEISDALGCMVLAETDLIEEVVRRTAYK